MLWLVVLDLVLGYEWWWFVFVWFLVVGFALRLGGLILVLDGLVVVCAVGLARLLFPV